MWRIGHRGADGSLPENTLASMRRALELNLDGFEFDIQLSKDNIPVVIHDDTLERTTNGKGLVSNHTLEELQRLDAGSGEKIPSLIDVIKLIDNKCRLFIELKAENSEKPVAEIISYAVKNLGWDYEHFYVCSFNHNQIKFIKDLIPHVKTCALLVGIPVSLAQIAVEAGAWSLNPAIDHVTKEFIDDAHRRGLKVLAWTADRQEQIDRAHALGIDGLFSNFPDKL
jgi:glycerophosphoryl diester phosphodiesterase